MFFQPLFSIFFLSFDVIATTNPRLSSQLLCSTRILCVDSVFSGLALVLSVR
ncbi:hypothetical protein BJV74DRAFT_833704 [Russula compacta]|nr:hypothetical protein BJV74DRAFT_833704 [Russula compacta]